MADVGGLIGVPGRRSICGGCRPRSIDLEAGAVGGCEAASAAGGELGAVPRGAAVRVSGRRRRETAGLRELGNPAGGGREAARLGEGNWGTGIFFLSTI